ncbi:MAG: peroxidase-related enzyme [Anaerolineae bacterium]|nr:peroxidase-related enzyme [Anaerolineae bacterium]
MTHHGEALRRLIKDESLVLQLKADYTRATLKAVDRAIVDYAVKLTRTPGRVTPADVEALREAGLRDRAILDVAQVTAYFNFVNRLAQGLGVSLEGYWAQDETA